MLVVTLMQRLVAGTTEKNSSLPESFFLGSEVRSQHVQDLLQTKVFGRGNWLSG